MSSSLSTPASSTFPSLIRAEGRALLRAHINRLAPTVNADDRRPSAQKALNLTPKLYNKNVMRRTVHLILIPVTTPDTARTTPQYVAHGFSDTIHYTSTNERSHIFYHITSKLLRTAIIVAALCAREDKVKKQRLQSVFVPTHAEDPDIEAAARAQRSSDPDISCRILEAGGMGRSWTRN
ncbi:hypothetical protein C8R44DRAFT_738907 [Mycena epipterygia]|nr:hypothetical protein C8R44DRAFT_738907 [Mycena epipterygia]